MIISGVTASHERRLRNLFGWGAYVSQPPREQRVAGVFMASTNGGQNGGTAAPQTPNPAVGSPPQLNVLAQYIKDFSFENPLAPRGGGGNQQQQPAINIQVGVTVNPLSETDIEVVLKIEGKAVLTGNAVLFAFELEYAGVFRIQNVPQESMQPLVLIECPRLLFPFAREIIATTVSNGGFPPLMLDPVDFAGLYRQNLSKAEPAGAAPVQA
jgi:preprotein translocase subunit SecB